LYAMAYMQGCVRAMYMGLYMLKIVGFFGAHVTYITMYMAMYMGLYVTLYMYAKTSQSQSKFDRKYPQDKPLDSIALVLPLKTRNLAIEVVTSHFCEVTNRVLGRNLATEMRKPQGKTQFARLARLRFTMLTYSKINVHVMYMYILLYAGVKKITSQTSLTSQIVKNPMFLAFFYAPKCEVTSQTPFSVTSLTSQSVTGG
jgi:hypothetical protein